MKGYITLDILRSALIAEQGLTVSKKIIGRTLKAMGFTYKKRKQCWISRRLQPGVQEKKKAFLEWVVTNSEKVEDPFDGTVSYRWSRPMAFYDETYIWKAVARLSSWTDKTAAVLDAGTCGKGTRANVLHALFSHIDAPPISEVMAAWLDSWTTAKKHPGSQGFIGKCGAETVQEYVKKCVAPYLGAGGTLVLDNASTHKQFAQKLVTDSAGALEIITQVTRCRGRLSFGC